MSTRSLRPVSQIILQKRLDFARIMCHGSATCDRNGFAHGAIGRYRRQAEPIPLPAVSLAGVRKPASACTQPGIPSGAQASPAPPRLFDIVRMEDAATPLLGTLPSPSHPAAPGG